MSKIAELREISATAHQLTNHISQLTVELMQLRGKEISLSFQIKRRVSLFDDGKQLTGTIVSPEPRRVEDGSIVVNVLDDSGTVYHAFTHQIRLLDAVGEPNDYMPVGWVDESEKYAKALASYEKRLDEQRKSNS